MPGFAFATRNPVYDTAILYRNPFTGLDPSCGRCVEMYRIYRPVLPAVNHVFIGAVAKSTCGSESRTETLVYGASKGPSDLKLFRQALEHGEPLELVARACGTRASEMAETATRISLAWEKRLSNFAYFALRITATPLIGRPCAVSANEIVTAIQAR